MLSCVRQGLIVGSKLFISNRNDIYNVPNVFIAIQFADDTSTFCSHSSVDTVCNIVDHELDKFGAWLALNRQSPNIPKTHYMIYSNLYLI